MFFLKLTLYTLAFYLAIALPIIVAELVLEFWQGGFGIHLHGRAGIAAFTGFWGIVWLTSFVLAVRTVFPGVWSKLVG